MSALRLSDFSPILANHRVMSVHGMVAGWLATMQPSLLALCSSRVQRTHASWAHEAGRGMRCFFLMSVGMMLGSVAVGDLPIALPGGRVLSAMSSAMLVGMLLGVLAEQLCERGLHLARTAQQRGNTRLGQREHSA
jgi:hypothetical protein